MSSSLSSGGQALMVEASSQVRVETSDSGGECEVRLRLVAVEEAAMETLEEADLSSIKRSSI